MRREELQAGRDYAYLPPDYPGHPLRATVVDLFGSGEVKVEVHHPDQGSDVMVVATKDLANGWYDEPDERYAEPYQARIVRGREPDGVTHTWERIAHGAHDDVRRQRALAVRLASVTGIRREASHYAGFGGTSANPMHTKLQLTFDELEELISRAENGPVNYHPGSSSRTPG
jgi:hypothetical protein